MKIIQAMNRDEAREQAIHFQASFEQNNYSYGELAEWSDYFTSIAKEYDLTEEFKENGIL